MGGQEPIRFGLAGFNGNYKVDVRDFDKFSEKGITLEQLKNAVGKENIKNMYLFEKMFKEIAKDDLMDANEIFGYFKKLDKAAELNENTMFKAALFSEDDVKRGQAEENANILEPNELNTMEYVRDNVNIAPAAREAETLYQFVNALINVNDENVRAEEQEKADAADLAARTTVDPKTGYKTVVDKGNRRFSTIYDKQGRKIQGIEIRGGAFRNVDNFDPEKGLLTSSIGYYNQEIVSTTKYEYDNNDTLLRSVKTENGRTTVTTYKNGWAWDIEKTVITEADGTKIVINGSEIEPDMTQNITYPDGRKAIITYDDWLPVKEVLKDAKGNVTQVITRTFDDINDSMLRPATEKVVDAKGNVISEVRRDNNGIVIYEYEKGVTTDVVKKENETITTKTKDDGTVLSTEIVKYLGEGRMETIKKDGNGNITSRVTVEPGELPGQTVTTTYNGNNEFVEKVAVRYTKDGHREIVTTKADGKVNTTVTSYENSYDTPYKIQKNAQGDVICEKYIHMTRPVFEKDVYYHNNKPYLSKVYYNGNTIYTYHNKMDKKDYEISREEYNKMLKNLKLYYSNEGTILE